MRCASLSTNSPRVSSSDDFGTFSFFFSTTVQDCLVDEEGRYMEGVGEDLQGKAVLTEGNELGVFTFHCYHISQ